MRRTALVAATALLAAAACKTPVPEATPLPRDDPRPAALVEAWTERGAERRSLRGRARMSVDGDEGGVRLRARQVLVLERPASLRVEILGLLSQVAAVLVTDGDQFQLFNTGDGTFTFGAVTPALLWETAYIALTPAEAAAVIVGAPPPDAGEALAPLSAAIDADGAIRVDLADARGAVRRRVLFDAEGRPRELEMRVGQGAVAWTARWEDYEELGGAPFAHKIVLDVAAGGTHAEISLSGVELNPETSPDMFQLDLPGFEAPGMTAPPGAGGE